MFFHNKSLKITVQLFSLVLLILLVNKTKNYGQYLVEEVVITSPIVVIDPGHGGKDKGCHDHHYNEKDIALTLSKKIGAQIKIKIPNAQIIFTRTKDEFIKLNKRVEIANIYQPDVFISVHANSIDVSEVHGSEIFILGQHKNKQNRIIEERENASSLMGYDMNEDMGITSFLLQSATKADNMTKSIELAKTIEHSMSSINGHKCRGIKQANFAVLQDISSPCVLLEAGYLTNSKDYSTLSSAHGQNIISDRIAKGIIDYIISHPRVEN